MKTIFENVSFFQYKRYLKSIGVDNYDFMDQLYDRSLGTIDPYSENLSDDIKNRIWIEMKRNIWYYFKVLQIPAIGKEFIPFNLDINTAPIIYLSQFNKNIFIQTARQTYTSSTVELLILHNFLFNFMGSRFYTRGSKETIKLIYNHLLDKIRRYKLPDCVIEKSTQYLHEYLKITDTYSQYIKIKEDNFKYENGILFYSDFEFINNNSGFIENIEKKNEMDANNLISVIHPAINSIIMESVINRNIDGSHELEKANNTFITWKDTYYDCLPQYQYNFKVFNTIEEVDMYDKKVGGSKYRGRENYQKKILNNHKDVLLQEIYLSRN